MALSRSAMPRDVIGQAALGATCWPAAQTKPASSRATAMTVLFTPILWTRAR